MIVPISINQITSFSNAFNSRAFFLLDRDDTFPYWLKSYSLPQITSNVDSIQLQQHPITVEPTTLVYDDFACTVYVDEFFLVYKNLHEWLVLSTPNENYASSKTDATLYILDTTV
jgi:hypothetical protein